MIHRYDNRTTPIVTSTTDPDDEVAPLRVGQAAELLGVTGGPPRRREADGRIQLTRSAGGQRLVPIAEVSRLLRERRRDATDRPIVAQSARNRFPGIVTRIVRDTV